MLPKIAAACGKPGLLQAYPPLSRYVASSSQHPAIRRVLAEMAPAWELREPAQGRRFLAIIIAFDFAIFCFPPPR
jgi:maleylpyruvate isomerase